MSLSLPRMALLSALTLSIGACYSSGTQQGAGDGDGDGDGDRVVDGERPGRCDDDLEPCADDSMPPPELPTPDRPRPAGDGDGDDVGDFPLDPGCDDTCVCEAFNTPFDAERSACVCSRCESAVAGCVADPEGLCQAVVQCCAGHGETNLMACIAIPECEPLVDRVLRNDGPSAAFAWDVTLCADDDCPGNPTSPSPCAGEPDCICQAVAANQGQEAGDCICSECEPEIDACVRDPAGLCGPIWECCAWAGAPGQQCYFLPDCMPLIDQAGVTSASVAIATEIETCATARCRL